MPCQFKAAVNSYFNVPPGVAADICFFPLNDPSGVTAANQGGQVFTGAYTGTFTLAQPGPLPETADYDYNAVLLDGSTAFVDFGTSLSTDQPDAPHDEVVYGGIFFKPTAFPGEGATQQLVANCIETATFIVDLNLSTTGGVTSLNFVCKPDASATAYTKSIVIATADEWHLALFAVDLTTKYMGVSHISPTDSAGSVSEGVVTGTSWPTSITTQTRTGVKDTIGVMFSSSAYSRYFDGSLAHYWTYGNETAATRPMFAPSHLTLGMVSSRLWAIASGELPDRRTSHVVRSQYSVQNLRI